MEITLAGFEGYRYQCKHQVHKADACPIQKASTKGGRTANSGRRGGGRGGHGGRGGNCFHKENVENVSSKATWNETAGYKIKNEIAGDIEDKTITMTIQQAHEYIEHSNEDARFCRWILSSDFFHKTFQVLYRAVCKTQTRTQVGD
jgi:hypothetical protein